MGCEAVGRPMVGSSGGYLIQRGFAMHPSLIRSASSKLASWASPLFVCVHALCVWPFALGCASVSKALRQGSWNSGDGRRVCPILGISCSSGLSFPRPQWGFSSCSKPARFTLWSQAGWAAGRFLVDFLLWCSPQNLCSEQTKAGKWCSAQAAGPASGCREGLGAFLQQGRSVPIAQALDCEGKT